MEVIKLGVTKSNKEKIKEVENIELLSGKGVVGDRHFRENNNPRSELTLIESENIDLYNSKFNTKIPYISFRRNVVTRGIELNKFLGKKLIIGEITIKVNDLCRPCKHLQEILNKNNIIKEFLHRGGLRCQILNSGKIVVGDKIKII